MTNMDKKSNDEKANSMARVMFTNLLLLGLDVEDMEGVYKIPFNEDMFNQFNKTGSEAVLHFLFYSLNPTLCNEQFRDCWPILDKKTEIHFRKTCLTWLISIKKNEPDEYWPLLNASSLQFPGRSKFIRILYSFSTHVLKHTIKTDLEPQQMLIYPSLQANDKAEIVSSSLQDNLSLELKRYIDQMYVTNSAHHVWKTYSDDLIKDYRGYSKQQRDIEQEKRSTVSLLAESAVKQGCALPVKRTLNMFDGTKDVTNGRREQRLQRVRALWDKVSKVSEELEKDRAIVKSVLEHSASKDRLEATDIGIRIPGLLLKQCEKEIQKQQIDNVFIGGRLNLLSVLQLWNLCLRLYIEQLETENVPDVSSEIPSLTMQAHKFHSFFMEIQALRKEMSTAFIPELENSIQGYRMEMNAQIKDAKNPSLDKSSLGLQLTTPTLPTSAFSKTHCFGDTPASSVPLGKVRKDTPNVVSEMVSSIANATLKGQYLNSSKRTHNFEQLRTSQRPPSASNTPKNSLSSLNVSKSTKHTPLSSMQGKQGALSKATRPSSKQTVRNFSRPSNDTNPALIGKKDKSGDTNISMSKAMNKNVNNEKKSSSYQKVLDDMAHSVVNSVIDGNDQMHPMTIRHSFSDDLPVNVNQNNSFSFSQKLMSELKRSPLPADENPSGGQRFQYNGARPKEKTGDSRKKMANRSPKTTRIQTKSRSPTDDAAKIIQETQSTETATDLTDFSPNASANGSSKRFLDDFYIEMSQSLGTLNERPEREIRKEKMQNSRNEKSLLDIYSPAMRGDTQPSNSSLLNYFDSNSLTDVTSMQDSLFSPASNYKQPRLSEEDYSNSQSRNWRDILDSSETDSVNIDILTDRGLGDGQASEHIQTAVQNFVFNTDGNESDNSEEEDDDDFLLSSHNLEHQSQHEVDMTRKPVVISNNVDDLVLPQPGNGTDDNEELLVASSHESGVNDIFRDVITHTSSFVDQFPAHSRNAAKDDIEDNVNVDDSFAPLKHGILLDNKSPAKALEDYSHRNAVENPKSQNSVKSQPKSTLVSSAFGSNFQNDVANLFAQRSNIFDGIDD